MKRQSTENVSRSTMQKRRKSAYELHARLYPKDTSFSNLRIPHTWRQFQFIEKASNASSTNVSCAISEAQLLQVGNDRQEINHDISSNHRNTAVGNYEDSELCYEEFKSTYSANMGIQPHPGIDHCLTSNLEKTKPYGLLNRSIVEDSSSKGGTDCDDENRTGTDGVDRFDNIDDEDVDSDSTNNDNNDDEDKFSGDHRGDRSMDGSNDEMREAHFDDTRSKGNVFRLDEKKNWSRQMTMKASVTKLEVLTSILAMGIRSNLTYATIELMLKNMNSMLVDSTLPCTIQTLWTSLLRNDKTGTTRHYYCRLCQSHIGRGNPTEECECGTSGRLQVNERSYFIQLNIATQLQSMFLDPKTVDSLRYRFTREKIHEDSIEDIYDGRKYKEHCNPGGFLSTPNNFSFTINTDGCSVSKSSNASAWPVLLQINEFPPHARKRHVILAGVWVDTMHPDLNMLLLPIVEELRDLHDEGIKWTNPIDNNVITSKFITLVCTVDSMARAPILNMMLHNGKYGCTYCYAEGKRIPGRGVQRRYPGSGSSRCRTDAEIRKHMKIAFKKEKIVFGIKGMSALLILPQFDMHSGPDIDSMHNVYLGVTKLQTSLLLHGKATDIWYAGSPAQLAAINTRLKTIRPPSRIARKPRPVQEMKNWKASEWRNWVLYYAVPCLDGIIRQSDLELVTLLSRAIYILNEDSISIEGIREARLLSKQYLENFEKTFGIINMKYNIHLLNHLVDSVEDWGPFWAHSAFPFEAWNKKIIDKVHSANSRPLQIATRYCILRFIEGLLYNPSTSYRVKKSIQDILTSNSKKRKNISDMSESCKFDGIINVDRRPPCEWESTALRIAGFQPKDLTHYQRAVIHNVDYRCSVESSKKKTRYCDNIVYVRSTSRFAKIIKIVSFQHNNEVINGLFLECMTDLGTFYGARHLRNVEYSSLRIFVNAVNNLLVPAILVKTPQKLQAVKLCNTWETD